MKKIFTLFGGFFCVTLFSAQSISNSSFEYWSVTNLFNEPDSFLSSNMWVFSSSDSGNVKKATDAYHGSFAAKLETVSTGNDTIQGMLLIGTPGNQTINGGIPYSGTPDSVSGYLKRTIQPGDTANFIVIFKNNGTVVGMAAAQFAGTVNNYSRFSIPVSYFGMPPILVDTLAVIISSSNMDPPKYPGSTLTIDSINFIGASQQFPNGSFENWSAVNTEEPDDWATLNFIGVSSGPYSATKVLDSYNGTFALSIESVNTPWNDIMGFVTNGIFGSDGPAGGMAVSANPQKVTGFYKYFPNGPDTALAGVFTYHYDSVTDSTIKLDSVVIHLTPANSYTYFEIPLTYNSWPVSDTANISFSSSNMEDSTSYKGLGSVLLIDNLDILYYPLPVGIQNTISNTSSVISVYPNPAKDILQLCLLGKDGENVIVEVFDLPGKKIQTVSLNKKRKGEWFQIDVKDLKSGIYFYRIIIDNYELPPGKIIIQ